MGSGELQTWNGHFDRGVYIDYTLEPLQSERHIEGTKDEASQSGSRIDEDTTIEIEDIEEENNSDQDESHRVDYMLAAGCGIISGAIDSLWVGKFDFDRAREWGSERVNEFVMAVAKMDPEYKGDDVKSAIRFLEKKYPFVGDRATSEFGGGRQHHLRDFSHHMSLGGLAFSLLTQFTGKVYGTDQHGVFMVVPVADEELIGKTIEEKLMLGAVRWFFHMVSDMAGSSGSAGKGTGIPGPILSLMKQLSALPLFKDAMTDEALFRKMLSKLFNGTLLKTVDEEGKKIYRRFDLRAELGIAHELARQSVPVLVNECLVCVCYAARRLYTMCSNGEVHDFKSLLSVGLDALLPHGSPLGTRMVTIATGVFSVVDMTDGAIRTLMRSGGKLNPGMVSDFLLHVNVVGVVRFVFAVHTDYKVHAKAKRETRLQAKFHGRGNGYGDDASVMRFFELDMVCSDLPGFEDKECTKYRKAVIKETSAIKGVKKAVLAGCVGIGVVAVATGGAAYVFAPAIAPILAGPSVAGLSGAALTSASLAAVGGGSLAAGGLGMSGGVALIAGGGALLGAVTGGGAATLGTWVLANQDAYVLNTCAKLIVFCRDVLMEIDGGVELVRQVRQSVCEQLRETEPQLDFLGQLKQFIKQSGSRDADSDPSAKRERSEALKGIDKSEKNMKRSVKYMRKCVKELGKVTGITDENRGASGAQWKPVAQIEKG